MNSTTAASRKRSAAFVVNSFQNDNVKRATVMIGVNGDNNHVTVLSKKSTPFTDPDRKDYRGPLRILSQVSQIQELTEEYIPACHLSKYRSICDADPVTGRPRMWGCAYCNWSHLQENKELVTYLERAPIPPLSKKMYECKCVWARHVLHESVYQRNHRNRQSMLQSCRNIIKNRKMKKPIRSSVYTPYPQAALNMLHGADLEGGEVYTTIFADPNELTWCPCVIYARDLRNILLEHVIQQKLKGIPHLGIKIMEYLMPFTPLPSSTGFKRCEHYNDNHNDDAGEQEDFAYFVDVKWVEKE